MASRRRSTLINPLNRLFIDLKKDMDKNDVEEIKNLLRGEQIAEEEMEKLVTATDIFHHLLKRGDIAVDNLDLLLVIFEDIGKPPLQNKVIEFQRTHNCLQGSATVEFEELDKGGKKDEDAEKAKLQAKQFLTKVLEEQFKLIIEGKDNAKLKQLSDFVEQNRATLVKMAFGSLLLTLSFLKEGDVNYFRQRYRNGEVEEALTTFFISSDMKKEAERAGLLAKIALNINEEDFEDIKRKIRAKLPPIQRVPDAILKANSTNDKWKSYVINHIHDSQCARSLLEQSKLHPVIKTLREEDFFFPALVSFWFENSNTFPPTVTKATEYAIMHHAEMYCTENNLEEENLKQLVKSRLNDIGKCLYEHIHRETHGKLWPSWITETIQDLESHLFGLVTFSEDCYSFCSSYVHSYAVAWYLSNVIISSPEYPQTALHDKVERSCETSLPYCSAYISGILGEKANDYLKELALIIATLKVLDIDCLQLLGNCLFETERPNSYARVIESVMSHQTLDMSNFVRVYDNQAQALSVILQNTAFITRIKLYSEKDEASLSSELKDGLEYIMENPTTVDISTLAVTINNSSDFIVTAKLVGILPFLGILTKTSTNRSGILSLTISAGKQLKDIDIGSMDMFVEALSRIRSLKELTLTGLGERFCERLLLRLTETEVTFNINTLCLRENTLSYKHCVLLLKVIKFMPCLKFLDLNNNGIDCLGCTALLPIKNDIHVSLQGNDIMQGFNDVLKLCCEKDYVVKLDFDKIETLDDVETIRRRLEIVKSVDCRKLSDDQLKILCLHLTVLTNVESINLSRKALNKEIAPLLYDGVKELKDLRDVNLSHCCINRRDLKCLLEHISPSVTSLNLSHTNMSGALLDTLKRFTHVTYLNLSSNSLTPHDLVLAYIAPSVTHLNLSQNNLWGEDFESRMKRFVDLIFLDVSRNKLKHVDVTNLLNGISTKMISLDLSHNFLEEIQYSFNHLICMQDLNISNAGLCNIENISLPASITSLNVSHNQVLDVGRSVMALSRLMQFDVSHNKVDSPLGELLKRLPTSLRKLDFSFNEICDVMQAGDIIAEFSELEFLDLSSNKIDHVGILQMLNSVGSHDMAKIGVGNSCVSLHAFLPYISDQIKPISIDLLQDNLLLSDVQNSTLFESLAEVSELAVSGLSLFEYSSVSKGLQILTKLRKLAITATPHIDVDDLCIILKSMSQILDLDLSNNNLCDKKMERIIKAIPSSLLSLNISHNMLSKVEQLKDLSKLKVIDISHNRLHMPMYSLMSNMPPNVKYLDVSFNKIKNAEGVGKCVSGFRELEHINMSSNKLGAGGVQTLSSEMENIDTICDINISHNFAGLHHIVSHLEDHLPLALGCNLESDGLHVKDNHLKELFRNLSEVVSVDTTDVVWSEDDYNKVLNDLPVMSKLEKLKLTSLKSNACQALATNLKFFKHLRHLDVSSNKIGNDGMEVIGDIIQKLDKLEYADVSDTDIDMNGIAVLFGVQGKHVKKPCINVAHNLRYLPSILPYVQDQLVESYSEDIQFNSDELPVHELESFLQVTKVTSLAVGKKLWKPKEFDGFIQGLRHLNLTHLSLHNGEFDEHELNHLCKLRCPSIEYVDLSRSNLGNHGAQNLGNAMEKLTRVTHLDLSNCNIGDEGAERLTNRIGCMDRLEYLCLRNNKIGDKGAVCLSKHLSNLSVIRHVDISGNNICDEGAKHLGKEMRSLAGLQHINFSHNNIKDDGAKLLISGRLIGEAKCLSQISYLDLSHNKITDGNVWNLTEGVPRSEWPMCEFTYLDLSHNTIGENGAESLSQGMTCLSNVTHLDLRNNQIGNRGAESLGREIDALVELRYFSLSHNLVGDPGTESLTAGLEDLPELTHLDLSNNKIGDSGVHRLSQGFEYFREMTYLDLSGNRIGKLGAMCLGSGMKFLSEVTHLDISYNNIGDVGADNFSAGMSYLLALKHLDLSRNNIGNHGAICLGTSMEHISELTFLNLSHNDIEDVGAETLSIGMSSLSAIEHLDLSWNSIGDHGGLCLGSAMALLPQVTHLYLCGNNIGDVGAESLSEGMRYTTNMVHIDVSHNKIGDKGAQSMFRVMENVAKLVYFNISHNNLVDSVQGLSQNIIQAKCLREIDVSHNEITERGIKVLLNNVDDRNSKAGCEERLNINLTHNNVSDPTMMKEIEKHKIIPKSPSSTDVACSEIPIDAQ